jgi:hypothetical protein
VGLGATAGAVAEDEALILLAAELIAAAKPDADEESFA